QYWDWKRQVPCCQLSALLLWWPRDAEVALMQEYFEHLGQCISPAKETPDWD
ncbi:hypothetical protein CPB97_005793, partial [Podila verticillata]